MRRISPIDLARRHRAMRTRHHVVGAVATKTINSISSSHPAAAFPSPHTSRLHRRTVSAIEAERFRIARDLHDEAGHRITSVMLLIDAASQHDLTHPETAAGLQSARRILAECLDGLQDVAFGLRPRVLTELGLARAVAEMAASGSRSSGTAIRLVTDIDRPALDREGELAAFRFVQEAVTNALRHAQCSRINITLTDAGNHYELCVDDNGRGFDLNAVPLLPGHHHGLRGMRDRLHMVGGVLTIRSIPGDGTSLTGCFPKSEVQ
jgi:signal transduction histidine kinase